MTYGEPWKATFAASEASLKAYIVVLQARLYLDGTRRSNEAVKPPMEILTWMGPIPPDLALQAAYGHLKGHGGGAGVVRWDPPKEATLYGTHCPVDLLFPAAERGTSSGAGAETSFVTGTENIFCEHRVVVVYDPTGMGPKGSFAMVFARLCTGGRFAKETWGYLGSDLGIPWDRVGLARWLFGGDLGCDHGSDVHVGKGTFFEIFMGSG